MTGTVSGSAISPGGGKPWPCPTETALLSGLHWDGREPEEAKES